MFCVIKVLVSSTCFDLKNERKRVESFLKSSGYAPVLSDNDDVYYSPSLHTHSSCIKAVEDCKMLVFIIGGRFGGYAVPEAYSLIDMNKIMSLFNDDKIKSYAQKTFSEHKFSITQLEVLKALELGIPVYTFIDDKVYHDHQSYEKNKCTYPDFEYSSIAKKETASLIFEFFNLIRKRSHGNSFFTFEHLEDFEEKLKKQFVGLMLSGIEALSSYGIPQTTYRINSNEDEDIKDSAPSKELSLSHNDEMLKRLNHHNRQFMHKKISSFDEDKHSKKKSGIYLTRLTIKGEEKNLTDVIGGLSSNDLLLIYGGGGAGKTFMLQREIVVMLNDKTFPHVLYLPLNELDFSMNQSIGDYIANKIFGNLDWKTHYLLDNNEIFFIFDGFNEIPVKNRHRYVDEISTFNLNFNCKIIIASRYEDALTGFWEYCDKAEVCKLREETIRSYLDISPSEQLGDGLLKILDNPLILSLYADTFKYNNISLRRPQNYSHHQFLCRWIPKERQITDSAILWNYLNVEVLKSRRNNQHSLILNWLTIRFIWPKLAFNMQLEDVFTIGDDKLKREIVVAITWIKSILDSHPEFEFASTVLSSRFNIEEDTLFNIIANLKWEEIIWHMKSVHSFFASTEMDVSETIVSNILSKSKFIHQSLRDCLAATHAINRLVELNISFNDTGDWSMFDFSKNSYLVYHFSNLIIALGKEELLYQTVENLRGKELSPTSFSLRNIFLVLSRDEFRKKDFIAFNFGNLDLRNCELTDYKLSGLYKGADFSKSKIGANTFKLPSHTRKITSIAVSSDGKRVITCGLDKILLWNLGDRTIEKEVHYYEENLGEVVEENIVAFSSDDKCVLYTDGIYLHEVNIETGDRKEYSESTYPITQLLISMHHDGIEYYLTRDSKSNHFRFKRGNISAKTILSISTFTLLSPTKNPFQHLAYDENKNLVLVDDSLNVIIKYKLLYTEGSKISISCDGQYFSFATKLISEDTKNKELLFDCFFIVSINSEFSQKINCCRACVDVSVAFSQRGNYLNAMMLDLDGTIHSCYFQSNEGKLQGFDTQELLSLIASPLSIINTIVLYENLVFVALNNCSVQISTFMKGDDRHYGYSFLDDHLPFIKDVAFSSISDSCFAVYEDGLIREWDYRAGNLLDVYPKEHKVAFTSICVAHNKELIACADYEGNITLWDSGKRSFIRNIGCVSSNLPFEDDYVTSVITNIVSFTHDDEYIISISGKGVILIWKTSSVDEPVFISKAHNCCANVKYYRFNEEDRIVFGDYNGNITFYKIIYKKSNRIELKEVASTNHAHGKERVLSFSLSPSGDRLISYGEDNNIIEWDAINGISCRKIIIESEYVNANSCCYAQDSKGVYLTLKIKDGTYSKTVIPVSYFSFDNSVNCLTLYQMEGFYWMNEGRIKRYDNHLISGDYYGKLYYFDLDNSMQNIMTVNAASNDKIKFCSGFDDANFFPEEIKRNFVNIPIIIGMFEGWIRKGIIPNVVMLAGDANLSKEIANIDTKLEIDSRIALFAKSLINSTKGNSGVSRDAELLLLEACLSYLCHDCPVDEKNMFMLFELLNAGINESSSKSNLDRLFYLLEEKSPDCRSVIVYKNYMDNYGKNNSVIYSVMKRFGSYYEVDDHGILKSCIISSVNNTSKEISIPEDSILSLAYLFVCNSAYATVRGDTVEEFIPPYSPANFRNEDEAHIIYLQILFHCYNKLPKNERTFGGSESNTALFNLLSKPAEIFIAEVSNGEIEAILPLLEEFYTYNDVCQEIDTKNAFICDFFREYTSSKSSAFPEFKLPDFLKFNMSLDSTNQIKEFGYDPEIKEYILLGSYLYEVFKYGKEYNVSFNAKKGINLCDHTKESVIFNLLEIIYYKDVKYVALSPAIPLSNIDERVDSDVYILKVHSNNEADGDILEVVDDAQILFDLHKLFAEARG